MNKSKWELGSRQEPVLQWVAENPYSDAQAIQRGIKYSEDQYGNINKTGKELVEKGYLTYRETESKKKIMKKDYFCTEKGVFYALSKSPDSKIIKILKTYEAIYKSFAYFRSEYERLGETDFILWFRDLLNFVPMLDNDNIDDILPRMLLYYSDKFEKMNFEDRKKLIQNAVDSFPSAKKMVVKMREMFGVLDLEDT